MQKYQDGYMPPASEDIIPLEELSYALRVEASTIRRNWIETGKLDPDVVQVAKAHTRYFFFRSRIEAIRETFNLPPIPRTATEWLHEFLDFMERRNLTRSYKPVLIKVMLKLADSNGEGTMDALVEGFRAFYVQRKREGYVPESGVSALLNPEQTDRDTIEKLIIKHPLERFILNGFMRYDAETGVVQFNPLLWEELSTRKDDVGRLADEQLRFYFAREPAQPQ